MKAILILMLALIVGGPASSLDLHVAPNGNDKNPGTKRKPFATLEAAQEAIRALKKENGLPTGGITVWIHGGEYFRLTSFHLTKEDSGTHESPITYRAWPGTAPRIIGGAVVKGFEPLKETDALARIHPEARGKVLKADLKAQGITEYGKLSRRGFGMGSAPAHMELFFQDSPMILARWPNDGWARIAGVPDGPSAGRFVYEGDRPQRWLASDDIWLHGYWTWDWADSYEKVRTIDTQAKVISTEPPHGVYGYKAGARYYALNILEELDQPGEYYIDRKQGVLYFWPPGPINKHQAVVSILEEPMIALDNVEYVSIRDLTLECTRGKGVEVRGASHLEIADCIIRNTGTVGITLDNTLNSRIVSCEICNTGDGGISINSGDRLSLTPSECLIANNRIHHFSRWSSTYHPGISVQGVGVRIAHNLIHDAPHSAIIFHGNEHIIEYNEIHHVCMETSDAGGIYAGRDFSCRRNVIRYNYIHDMGGADVRSIYLDDNFSDVLVAGNIIYKGKMGVCIGGGRANVIENNIFIECIPSVHLDNRGENWAQATVEGFVKERLEAVNFRHAPWKDRYPELLTLYDDEPGKPKYNVIERNISVGGEWLRIYSQNYDATISIKNNLVDIDPGFVDAAKNDFRLKDDSAARKIGFRPIPFEKIGLVNIGDSEDF